MFNRYFKRAPAHYTIDRVVSEIKDKVYITEYEKRPDGTERKFQRWVPARPFGLFSLRNRIVYAWKVFKGDFDVLEWPGQ